MEKNKEIRMLSAQEIQAAMDLVWNVFAQYEAPRLPDEAVEEFWSTVDYEYMIHRFGDGTVRLWGAFDNGTLAGVCVIRELRQVLMLYVAGDYQGQGVGTNLLKKAVIDCKKADESLSRLTVLSTLQAQGFFEKQGFVQFGEEEVISGCCFVPMALESKK